MEYVATFAFAVGSNTKELAKLKCGAFIKEMIDRFYQKIISTLKPNRSLWLYSAHDFTISNLLNSLGLFEKVILSYRKNPSEFFQFNSLILSFLNSCMCRQQHPAYILNSMNRKIMKTLFKFSIENRMKISQCQ